MRKPPLRVQHLALRWRRWRPQVITGCYGTRFDVMSLVALAGAVIGSIDAVEAMHAELRWILTFLPAPRLRAALRACGDGDDVQLILTALAQMQRGVCVVCQRVVDLDAHAHADQP